MVLDASSLTRPRALPRARTHSVGPLDAGGRTALFLGAAVALLGLVAGVVVLAIGLDDLRGALLLLVAGGALGLMVFSPALSFVYQCIAAPAAVALNAHGGAYGPGKLTFYLFILLSSLAAGVTLMRGEGGRRTFLGPAVVLFFVFVVYLGGHVVGAESREAAFESFIAQIHHWPFVLLPAVLLRERWQVRVLLVAVAAIGALLAFASLGVAFVLGSPSDILSHGGTYQRVHLYFGTANSLGVFLSIAFFVLLHAVPAETRLRAVAKIGVQFVMLAAILLTFSRRAWLATGVLLLVHYVRRRDWRALVAVVLAAGALSYQTWEQVERRAEGMLDPTADINADREREISEHLRFLFGDGVRALGWGIDNATSIQDVKDGAAPGGLYFHNYYLTLYYLAGAIGLALYLGLCFFVFTGLLRARRWARGPDTRGAIAAGLSALFIVLVTGVAGMLNVTFPVNYYSALVPGLAFAAWRLEAHEATPRGA